MADTMSPSYLRGEALPSDVSSWPEDAEIARREVLRQLDGWCRTYDRPTNLNSWIAEEAIRRS
jgi:hypothetical protein